MGRSVKKWPASGTIGCIVLDMLMKNMDVKVEVVRRVVLRKFKESKFDKSHLSWYKYMLKRKLYVRVKG